VTVAAFDVTRTVPAGTFTDCLQFDYEQITISGGVTTTTNGSVYLSKTAGSGVDEVATSSSTDGTTETFTNVLQPGFIANL